MKVSSYREAVSVLYAGADRALRHSGRSVLPLRPVLKYPMPVERDGLREAVLDVNDDRVTFKMGRSVSSTGETVVEERRKKFAPLPLLTSMSGPGYWPFTTSLWSELSRHAWLVRRKTFAKAHIGRLTDEDQAHKEDDQLPPPRRE